MENKQDGWKTNKIDGKQTKRMENKQNGWKTNKKDGKRTKWMGNKQKDGKQTKWMENQKNGRKTNNDLRLKKSIFLQLVKKTNEMKKIRKPFL